MSQYKGKNTKESSEDGAVVQPKKKRKLLIALGAILGVIAVLLISGYAIFNHFYSKMNIHTGLTEEELQQIRDNYNPEDFIEPEDIEAAQALANDGTGNNTSDNADGTGTDADAGTDSNAAETDVVVLTEEETVTFEDELRAQVEAAGGDRLADTNVINILLIGTDSRTEELNTRSDAMILVSINKNTKEVILTSFARDVYIYIPDLGYSNRLNAACRMGGPTMLVNTLEHNFGIEIDGYAMVNFYSFVDVVDAIGGVDVELRQEEMYYLNYNLGVQNDEVWGQNINTDKLPDDTSGVTHLNGNQTLAYARIRKLGGDTERTARQRAVLSAIIEKAKGMTLTELYDLANIVLPMVATDLSQADCLSLLLHAGEYLSYDIQSMRIPEKGYYFSTFINDMSVYKMDFDVAREIIKEEIYGITDETAEEAVNESGDGASAPVTE